MFELPVATLVQDVIASPTLPQPFPFIKTVVDPVVIGAAGVGHVETGSWCVVLLSPCLLIPVPFTVTLELNSSLFGVEQCVTSESTLLPLQIAGTLFLH